MEQKEYLKLIEDWKIEHKEEIENGKCKKVFTENLPKGGKYISSESTNWKSSVGYKIYFIYENVQGWIEIIEYLSNNHIKTKYNNNEVKILVNNISKGKIGAITGKITKEFKIEIGTHIQDDKRDIIITDRKYIENPYNKGKFLKWYKYYCNKCSFDCGEHWSIKDKKYKDEYWIQEISLIRGGGCSCCCQSSQVVVKGINDIFTTDTWMIPIIGEECAKTHTHGSTDKIYPTCPDCKNKRNKKLNINSIYRTHSMSCEICGDGVKYPNKAMTNILEQLNINFEIEYSPEWINPKRYDFYIPSINLIIEMDGGLGHGIRKHSKNNVSIEESKEIDDYKDEQARLHGIEVIRIDCDYCNKDKLEYIKQNILNYKRLNKLFTFSDINWNKVNEFASSNLVKQSCELKKNNPNLTTTDIGKIMGGYTRTVVKNWLHIGNKLNWCIYNAKEENIKSAIKCGKANAKQVEMFKDGASLGVFNSATELARQSEKLFGVKLIQSSISQVCLMKHKTHKGFTFKYTK